MCTVVVVVVVVVVVCTEGLSDMRELLEVVTLEEDVEV